MAMIEPSCNEAYAKVFADADPTDWCTLGYSGRKIAATGTGTGGLSEVLSSLDDGAITYALIRLSRTDDGGDSKRVKFVFLTWVGENAPAMKKGQVTAHKPAVGALFKGYHVEKQIFERSELEGLEAALDADLKKAAGANYDMGNINSGVKAGGTSGIKNASKEFFMQKDKETEIKGAVYEKHTSGSKGISACDLGGRSMTAPPTEAKRNTVGYEAPAQVASSANSDSAVEKSPVATREEAVAHVEPASPAKEVAGVEDAAPAEDTPAEGSTVE
mmetsp:Transcript_3615/g.7063  ORF Transcript_3615/g.7063 Transcript_3615/m.7063 type:complete len:274 (-) Transcript_3615:190-1011(-)